MSRADSSATAVFEREARLKPSAGRSSSREFRPKGHNGERTTTGGTGIDLFKMSASNFMKAEKISLLVVDSLEVMEAMAKFTDRRSDMYYLFDWLRDLGTTSLIISENPVENPVVGHYPEEAYLADGIIQLGLHPTTDLYVQRRLRCM